MELIDAHAHLTNEQFDDVKEVIERSKEGGVTIICSAYSLDSSKQAVNLSERYHQVFANAGIHPENVDEFDAESLKEIQRMAMLPKTVAVGEIGLDYHYRQDNKDQQMHAFISQIKLANSLNKPIVVHSRDCMADTIEILKKYPPKKPSLMHCFSGSFESAEILMKLGFCFSFGGVVTFSNAKNVLEVVKKLPTEKILLETDCPYMSPVPFRGKRNEPKNVVYIADKIAQIKQLSLSEIAEITTKNAKRLFNI